MSIISMVLNKYNVFSGSYLAFRATQDGDVGLLRNVLSAPSYEEK